MTIAINIKDKIIAEQWERLNKVANEAIRCDYFTEDKRLIKAASGKTERELIEDEAVESFVNFLEMYFVTDEDRYNRDRKAFKKKEKKKLK